MSVRSLRRDQAALSCPGALSLLWEPSSPLGVGSRAVVWAGHRALCVPQLLGTPWLYHFIWLGLALVFPCSSFPFKQSRFAGGFHPRGSFGEQGRVILDLIIELRHSLPEPEVKHQPPQRLLSQHCPCLSCPEPGMGLSLGLLF